MAETPGSCLACDLSAGRLPLPGGLIHGTEHWRVEHCVGPLGVETLIVTPIRHVLLMSDLEPEEGLEMGPVLHGAASAVRELTDAQVYVCLWSHGPLHIRHVIQPVFSETVARFGAHGPGPQAAMFELEEPVDAAGAERFAARARQWYAGRVA